MKNGWHKGYKWPYPAPQKTEFIVNPGVNRYYVAQCLTERWPNIRFHIVGEATNNITVFDELDSKTKSTIENDIQVLCIAYDRGQKWEW